MSEPTLESVNSPRRSLLWRNRWLISRRCCQLALLLMFLSGPWFGVWVFKGNLAASLLFDTIPLADPLIFLQMLLAGHWLAGFSATILTGAMIVLLFYAVFGGRVFCSWVCPVNLVTDASAWLRRRFGLKSGHAPDSATRYWVLGAVLVATALTGKLIWEWVNPVTLLHRAIVFGLEGASLLVFSVFVYDFVIAGRGWCGRLCPVGAFYSVLGRTALLRISAARRQACDDCLECFVVCPEPAVIRPALKSVGQTHSLILSGNCTNCGRCIDVCDREVFKMTHRFDQRSAQ